MSDENLAAAILSGDIEEAKAILEDMRWTSPRWGNAYREGRLIAFPLAPLPPLATPFALPAPGHLPGSTLGDPRLAR
ncbi:MAG: hypothetical protein ABIV36_22590 [Sphingobium limneticum]